MAAQEMILEGSGRVWRGAGECQLYGLLEDSYTYDRKHQEFGTACSEPVHCANAFMIGSSNVSFARTSRACASVAFLTGIISL
jgi:hypothetical protein